MRVFLLAALLLISVLAGCAERTDAISAKDGLGPAREAARAHGDDPVLVGLMSIEPMRHAAGEDYEVWIHLDKDPGDGRAPGWLYLFRSGDRTIGIAYAAGLGIIAEGYETGEAEEEFDGDAPIQDWLVDSTQAARILRGLDFWPQQNEDLSVFWSLHQGEAGPVWSVEWENQTIGGEVLIDARTGNVTEMDLHDRDMDEPFPCAMAIGPGGSVTPLHDRSVDIDVADEGSLGYQYDWTTTVGQIEMSIVGPDGLVESETLTASGSAAGALAQLAAGTYTMTFEADIGLGQVSGITLTSC